MAQSLLFFGFAIPGFAPYTGAYFALAAMLYGFRYPLRRGERFSLRLKWSGDRRYRPDRVGCCFPHVALADKPANLGALARRLVASVLLWFFLNGTPDFERIMQSIVNAPAIHSDIISGRGVERAALITGSIGAYLDAPVLGHGFSRMTSAIVPHLSPEKAGVAHYGHLHSDLADVVASGGAFRLAALGAFLFAPLVAVPAYRGTVSFYGLFYLSIALGLGFLLLGLTNAVIGLLPQTALLGISLGYLVGATRRET